MTAVLIIEDDPVLREYLCESLVDASFDVFEAANGLEGIRLFERHRPANVLTDLVMDEGEGIESIQAIRKIGADVHIIAMSGNPYYLRLSGKLGANRMLLKPFWMPQLLSAFEQDPSHEQKSVI